MGADASLPLSGAGPDLSTMSMTFRDGDLITVLHLDSAGLSVVAQAIKDTWQAGIQLEKSVCGTGWSFKLNGYPFSKFGAKTSQQSREMLMQILKNLHGIGYQVATSGVLGTRADRSTLFFKKSPTNAPTPHLLCVSFDDSDKILFTNLPSQLTHAITDAVRSSWSRGIQRVDAQFNGVLQFKLVGRPWTASNNEQSIVSKSLLQAIFVTLYRYQWIYHVNVNLNRDQDCLIFRHDPAVDTYGPPQFCMMSFGEGDRLRLQNASDETISMIRRIIENNWSPGRIQDEIIFHGSHEFKISGHPWNSVREESARARYLMVQIFQEMLQRGWHNVAGFSLSRERSDRAVLVFEKREPANCPMFCIAPHDDDKFWLINVPGELVSLFKQILRFRWSSGIQSEKALALQFGNVYKLKLSGTPWAGGERNSPIHARSFLCTLVEEFSNRGWNIMVCVDVTSRIVAESDGPDYPFDVYSFWFAYNNTTDLPQPSAPVFDNPNYADPPPPIFHEPPPTYNEATGWNDYGTKQ